MYIFAHFSIFLGWLLRYFPPLAFPFHRWQQTPRIHLASFSIVLPHLSPHTAPLTLAAHSPFSYPAKFQAKFENILFLGRGRVKMKLSRASRGRGKGGASGSGSGRHKVFYVGRCWPLSPALSSSSSALTFTDSGWDLWLYRVFISPRSVYFYCALCWGDFVA